VNDFKPFGKEESDSLVGMLVSGFDFSKDAELPPQDSETPQNGENKNCLKQTIRIILNFMILASI